MSPLVIVDASVSRAMPKSTTRGPSGPSSTLAGLKSRCTTPAPWMAVSAVAVPTARRCRSPSASGPRSSTRSCSDGPSMNSLTTYAPLAFGRRLDDPGRDERLHLVDRVDSRASRSRTSASAVEPAAP